MTIAPAAIVPSQPTWRSLLGIVPLTLLWMLLIYWQPLVTASGVPTAAVRLLTYALIGVGLSLGLEANTLTSIQRRTTWLAIMVPFTIWAAIAWSVVINGTPCRAR